MSIKKIYIGIAFISCFFFILSSPVAAEQKIDGQLIIINKSVNKLAFFEDGILQRVFHVATGKYAQLTPEGIFPIVTKKLKTALILKKRFQEETREIHWVIAGLVLML